MTVVDLHDFCQEIDCIYDGEQYSVRDNGAVFRHPRPNKRQRPMDALWTYGMGNNKYGYMEIASARVHRIVATAFHGNPPTPEHVVDHIDTNRRNNRPDNLRWLTRLENALKNPITLKRIELCCGSIEAFLADPSKLHQYALEPNYEWMRTVSLQEAQACLERMHVWAKSDKPSSGGTLGEWVFKPSTAQTQTTETVTISPLVPRACRERVDFLAKSDKPLTGGTNEEWESKPVSFRRQATNALHEAPAFVVSKTLYAVQRNWRVPAEFPCCPQEYSEEPIPAYAARLEVGAIFARNDFSESVIMAFAMSEDRQSLWVMCEFHQENVVKPWALVQATFKDSVYVHSNLGSFFAKEGAEKQFCLAQGLEWTGGDSIDDYC